jgi:hypothetical protein
VYFLLFWAGTFVFWAASGLAEYPEYGLAVEGATDVFLIIGNLFGVAAGIVLGILAVKLRGSNFMGTLSKERLLVYFLLFGRVISSSGAWNTYLIMDRGLWNLRKTLWDLLQDCLNWRRERCWLCLVGNSLQPREQALDCCEGMTEEKASTIPLFSFVPSYIY